MIDICTGYYPGIKESSGVDKTLGKILNYPKLTFLSFFSFFFKVSVFDENTQQKCDVFGRFPLTDAWW